MTRRWLPVGAALGVLMVAAAPGRAQADNCGSLSDCFFTLETAILAAVVIAVLIVLIIEFAPLLLTVQEIGLAAGTGAVLEGVEGGAGLGSLAGVELEVTAEGLSAVEAHLAQFGEWAPNAAMLQRLQAALEAGTRFRVRTSSFLLALLQDRRAAFAVNGAVDPATTKQTAVSSVDDHSYHLLRDVAFRQHERRGTVSHLVYLLAPFCANRQWVERCRTIIVEILIFRYTIDIIYENYCVDRLCM